MNKLVPLFTATMLALSGAVLAQDESQSTPPDSPARPDASKGQEAQPKGFVLIQRNIYVPVDEQGNVASEKLIVIDKQGFITAEEMEKAASEATSESSEDNAEESDAIGPSIQPPAPTPSLQKRKSPGEGPMILS